MQDRTKVNRGLGTEVRAWLERALEGQHGLTRSAVIERSGVARGTFYRLLAGEGDDVEQATLDRLAEALDVPPPQIVAGLSDVPAQATTPIALVQEAQRLLRHAETLMATSSAVSDADAIRAVKAAKAADPPARRSRRSS